MFFAQYGGGIEKIEDIKNDDDKKNLKEKINKTCNDLQDNLKVSLEGMYATVSNLHDTISEDKEEHYNDCQNDIKDKLDIIGKITAGLKENIQIIENSIGSDKRILNKKGFKNISKLTNNEDIIHYFYSMKIYGYYEISIDVKKDYFGIFFSIALGALEIIGGCILLCYTGGQFGSELINEGYNDIKYGIECLLGKKEFSWSEFGMKKLNFLLETAASIALKIITGGLSQFSKSNSLKTVFKQVGKKILRRAAIDVGKAALTHFIGPQVMEELINNVKNLLKKGVIQFFGDKLKAMIPKEFREIMLINVVVHKGKSPIGRILKEQLKNGLKILSKLINILINMLLGILKAITTSKNPTEVLKNIFANAKNSFSNTLKSGLKDSLNSILHGSLSEIKNLIEGKFGKKGVISSWTDYFIQEARITEEKAYELTNALTSNGILSLDGELNLNETSENNNQKSNFKIKLNIANNNLLRNITKPIRDIPGGRVKKIINNIRDDIKYRIEQEIQSIISYSNEFFNEGIQLLSENKEEVKNNIKDKINIPKDEIINSSINFLNDIKKSIINNINIQKENSIKEFDKFENKFINIDDTINNIYNNHENNKISNVFFEIIKAINKKIDVDKIININNFLSKFICHEILDKYIPTLKTINIFLDNSKLDKFLENILNKLDDIIEEEINPFIDYIIYQKKNLDKNGLKYNICKKIKITLDSKNIINSIESMKNKYIDRKDNIKDEIKSKIDDLILSIYDLDDKINEKENDIIDKLLAPYDEIKDELENILCKIEEKVGDIKSTVVYELDKLIEEINAFAEKFIDKSMKSMNDVVDKSLSEVVGESKICSKVFEKGNKLMKNGEEYLEEVVGNVVKKPAELLNKLKSLSDDMKKYEESSGMDETINLLNDTIIDALIDILGEALKNSSIGNFIKNCSEKVLKAMESTKKDLKSDLMEIGEISEKKNYLPLPKINEEKKNKDMDDLKENSFEILQKIKKLTEIFQSVISNKLKRGFKLPEESKSVTYINFKFADNPFKKIIFKQLEILLKTLKDILPLINNFIKAIISSIRGRKEVIKDIINVAKDFSYNQTWSDYFIKGIKVCSSISEAETLSQALVENNIISLDGELNKEKILELNELNQIRCKNFPIHLKLDLNEQYNKIKNKIGQKINNILDFNPKEKILSLINDMEKQINKKIKENLEIIEENSSIIFGKGIDYILFKENEYKNLIKNRINIAIEQILKELISTLNQLKNNINNKSNNALNYGNDLYDSFWNKINNIEEFINKNFESIIIKLIKEVFGNNNITESLKNKIILHDLIKYINEEASLNIFNSIIKVINPFINQINNVNTLINKDFKEIDCEKLKENIINIFNSFLFKFKNDINPFIEYIQNIKIKYNEIELNKFKLNNIFIPINSLQIMKTIKERKKR